MRAEQLSPWSPSFTRAQLWSDPERRTRAGGKWDAKLAAPGGKHAAVSSQKAQQLESLVPPGEQQQAKDSPRLVGPLHGVDFSCTELLGRDIPLPQGARQDDCIWASIPLRRASPSAVNRRCSGCRAGRDACCPAGPRGFALLETQKNAFTSGRSGRGAEPGRRRPTNSWTTKTCP